MSTAQQKNDIAKMFTATERITLRVWFDLDSAGKDVDADRFLDAGLQLEHFQSRLDDDPAKRSAEDLAQMNQLQSIFDNELELARGILASTKPTSTVTSGRRKNNDGTLPIITETVSFEE